MDHEAVLRAVADVARFDVFQLSEAWLAGDAARAMKIIAALEAEGEALPHLLWQLGEDIRALASVLEATGLRNPLSTSGARNARVWGKTPGSHSNALARGCLRDRLRRCCARWQTSMRCRRESAMATRVGRSAYPRAGAGRQTCHGA
jgi:DNA polymerase-3 subunit delta